MGIRELLGKFIPTLGTHVRGCRCGYCSEDLGGACPFLLHSFLELSTAAALITAANEHAMSVGGWGSPNTTRHRQYPTTDMSLSDIPDGKAVAATRASICNLLLPSLGSIFGVPQHLLSIIDIFIVRYAFEDGIQNHLPLHTDGSRYSFNMLLSSPDDFDGGGTFFEVLDRTCKPGQGEVLLHRGDLRHAGMPVTRGTRYILVGFVDCATL